MLVNTGLGNLTPPVAPLLYLAGRIGGNLPLNEYLGPAIRFMIFAYLPVIFLVTFVPEISLTLPRLIGFPVE